MRGNPVLDSGRAGRFQPETRMRTADETRDDGRVLSLRLPGRVLEGDQPDPIARREGLHRTLERLHILRLRRADVLGAYPEPQ